MNSVAASLDSFYMSESERPTPRVLVATVTAYRSRTLEELAKTVTDDVRAVFSLARSVIVKGRSSTSGSSSRALPPPTKLTP